MRNSVVGATLLICFLALVREGHPEISPCDYTEMQLKAVITCHCTVFPAEDIELMVKARRRMFGDISTFQLVRRYCKTAPALLRNFKKILTNLARKENAELIGHMMSICSNATLYYLPLTPNS